MNRRLIAVLICLFGIAATGGWWWHFGRSPRLSVVLITLDTTRADRIGSYGHTSAATPHLDRFADRSVQFDRAYTVAPITLPAHATLLTGLLPPEHGLRINSVSRLPESIGTLAETLNQQGYRTGAFVSSLVLDNRFGLARGFEKYDDDLDSLEGPRVERPAAETVTSAITWLNEAATDPVFCWVHLYDTHEPYDGHEDEFGDRFVDRPYDGELAYVDLHVGRFLDAVTQLGLDDHTLVIVVGDHGEGLGEHGEATHGYLAYNSTLHVPLLVRHPVLNMRETHVAEPVSLADVYPTILDGLHLEIPPGLAGRSLLPCWQTGSLEARPCYGETEAPYMEAGWSPVSTWTTQRWKYIHSTIPELFDLEADSGETNNLCAQQPEQVAQLSQELADFTGTLTLRTAEATSASAAELKALRGLGYAGGQAPAQKSDAPLRDIKETLHYAEQVHHCMHLIDQRDTDEAQRILEGVVAALPDYPKAWGTLGVCYAVEEDYVVAEQHFRRALDLDANQNFARIGLGRALFAQDRLDDCVEQLATAVRVEPSALDAQYYLGEACRRLQRWDESRTALAAAIEIDPTFIEAQVALADLARDQGDLDTAADRYRQVLQRDPSRTAAAFSLSRVQSQLARDGEAIQTLEGLLIRNSRHVEGLTALARILATTENPALRDVVRGVTLAEQACRLTDRRAAAPLRTLAVAQAAAGRLDAAMAAAESALAVARESQSDSLATEIEAELEVYRRRDAEQSQKAN